MQVDPTPEKQVERIQAVSTVGRMMVRWFLLAILVIVLLLSAILSPWLWSRFRDQRGHRDYQRVQQSVAVEDFDEALTRAEKIRDKDWRKRAFGFIVDELSSAERYDEAFQTANRMPSYVREYYVRNIVEAAASDERFNEVDKLISLFNDQHCRDEALCTKAVAQVKAGLFDDAAQTMAGMSKPSALDETRYAEAFAEIGQFDKALQLMDAFEWNTPTLGRVYDRCKLASKCVEKNETEQSLKLLREAVRLLDEISRSDDRIHGLDEIISVCGSKVDVGQRVRFFEELSSKFKSDADLYPRIVQKLAAVLAEKGDFAEAWKLTDSLPPSEDKTESVANILYYLAKCGFVEGFTKGIRLIDDKAIVFSHLEFVVRDISLPEDRAKLIPLFEKALAGETDPVRKYEALARLAFVQTQSLRFDDALSTIAQLKRIRFLRSVKVREIDKLVYHVAIGQAHAGQPADAEKTATVINDRFFRQQIPSAIAVGEARAGRFDEALRRADKMPKEDDAYFNIAGIQIDKGLIDDAEKTTDKVVKPIFRIILLFKIADKYLETNRKQDAARIVPQLVPLMNQVWDQSRSEWRSTQFSRIAVLQAKLGDFTTAIETARRISINDVPIRAKTLAAIAEMQADAGNLDDARKTLEQIRWRSAAAIKEECTAKIEKNKN